MATLLSDDVLRAVIGFLQSRPVRFVHYCGEADEGLVKALIACDRYEISRVDRKDKYGAGARCYWEEGDPPVEIEPPEWFDKVTCYVEGGPNRIDALIWDDKWLYPGQLDKILNKALRPRFIILAGPAITDARHPFCDWTEDNGLLFGELKPGLAYRHA